MLSQNSDRYLEYSMAVPWAGAALNPCNIRWSVDELLYSLDDSESSLLIVDDAHVGIGREIAARARTLEAVIHASDGETAPGMTSYEALVEGHAPVEDADLSPDDLAGIFYTGGTTGFPKGVMLSHQNLWSSAMCYLLEGICPPDAVYLHAAPMFHLADYGVSVALFIRGGTHAIVSGFEPEAVVKSLSEYGVTDLLLVPTMIQMLVDHPAMASLGDALSLRRLVYGASPISDAVLERAIVALPNVEFAQVYGMTELSPLATFNPFILPRSEDVGTSRMKSAGRPTFSVDMKIVDADGLEAPRGTAGEVVVRGPNVMLGYWKKPEETKRALRDGWMHTGDVARMDPEGYIYIADRLKDMIITGGENVYSAEVENVVAQHPAVASCAVFGIPSEKWGETVHAAILLKPGHAADADDIIAHCRDHIGGFKCPRTVEFRTEFPLSGAGKILKSELRKPYWEGKSRSIS
ncbi:hypothetical protein A4X03_0g7683 [Tilletia caries]|uniref:Fatty-acid--CoA ligase n=1 Tax=Tilletia caries TaxID=13290 RepID=A0A8T8SP07_9BASI|nr:hypothetical protein A4X03_0g7683 [Tilletia caries]